MDSLIARQKIARRRPFSIAPAPRKQAFPKILGPKGGGSRPRPPVDYLFLEGSAGPSSGARPGPKTSWLPAQSPFRSRARRGYSRKGLALSGIVSRIKAALGSLLLRAKVSAARPKPPLSPVRILILLAAGTALLGAGLALSLSLARTLAFPLPATGLLPKSQPIDAFILDYVSPELADDLSDPGDLAPAPPPTLEVSTYTVKAGDSLPRVAQRFGLNVDTLVSMNGTSAIKAFKTGTELKVPNMNGIVHRVAAGQSMGSIARLYKSDITRLVDANDLGTTVIRPGQVLFIPGARLSEAELRKVFGDKVAWPARGPLSSYFGYRADPFTGVRSYHAGIDIVVAPGTPVRAAMDGVVADLGYNPNFGNYVILSHADGLQTLYGHLSAHKTSIGARVAQGTVIGLSGSTGYSTGPHLHFGLYRRGAPMNPLKFLK